MYVDVVRLVKDGVATDKELMDIRASVQAEYDKAFEESKTWEAPKDEWLSSKWAGFKSPGQVSDRRRSSPHVAGWLAGWLTVLGGGGCLVVDDATAESHP